MKKIIAIVMISLMTILTIPSSVQADFDAEVLNPKEYVDYIVSDDGTIAERLTDQELILALSKEDNISAAEVMQKYNINPFSRDTSTHENYRIYKKYSYSFSGYWGGNCDHNAYVQITRSNDYSVNYVNTITKVYTTSLSLYSSDFWKEDSANYVTSSSASSIRYYWEGNICYKTNISIV